MFPPSRIVCLTEETVETLYLLGEQDRIVGISGYVVRPPQARREKPRVSTFSNAKDCPTSVTARPHLGEVESSSRQMRSSKSTETAISALPFDDRRRENNGCRDAEARAGNR